MTARRGLRLRLQWWAWVASFCLTLNGLALAGVTLPLYEESLTVTDKSTPARVASMRVALANVLIRVSGNPKLMSNSAIEKLTQSPEQYLQAYEYRTQESNNAKTAAQWKCRYVFDTKKINQLLTSHGQTVWATHRPNVLLWWAVAHDPEGKDNEIYKHDSQATFLTLWKQQAKLRGFVTTLPMNELTTQSNIEMQDIAQLNADKLKLASNRYHTDMQAAFLLKISKEGVWQGSLQLLQQNTQAPLKLTDRDPNIVITGLIDQLVGQLARKPPVKKVTTALKTFTVTVRDIHDRKHFQKMSKYLAGLSSVKEVQVLTVATNQVKLTVRYQGDETAFAEKIERDNILQLINGVNSDTSQHAELQLQLIG